MAEHKSPVRCSYAGVWEIECRGGGGGEGRGSVGSMGCYFGGGLLKYSRNFESDADMPFRHLVCFLILFPLFGVMNRGPGRFGARLLVGLVGCL